MSDFVETRSHLVRTRSDLVFCAAMFDCSDRSLPNSMYYVHALVSGGEEKNRRKSWSVAAQTLTLHSVDKQIMHYVRIFG